MPDKANSAGRAGSLLNRLAESRAMTDELFRIVRPGALYSRPIPERHRIIFYIGHLEAFDWNLIGDHALGRGSAHKEFDHLFAFGIDPVGRGLPTDQPSDWPSINEVQAYIVQARKSLDEILQNRSLHAESGWRYPCETILNVAIEHRIMHAETLAYMLHQLAGEAKSPPRTYRTPDTAPASPAIRPRMVEIPAGQATLGISEERESFGWDNEFKTHSIMAPAFAMDASKVTNGEFLKFVLAGCYDDQSLWRGADWDWIKGQNVRHPQFWRERGREWFYQAMFEELPLPMDWPVYVSHAEASAYARFVGKSLPTESQFHRAAYGTPEGEEREYPWGEASPAPSLGNFDFERWDPVAVGSYPAGRSAFGVEDAVGNGWEWTATEFAPFPGFEPFPFYRGYSANFFDGKHYVMKGASPRTGACLLRRSFRNWFQPHYPFVYASFRCVMG